MRFCNPHLVLYRLYVTDCKLHVLGFRLENHLSISLAQASPCGFNRALINTKIIDCVVSSVVIYSCDRACCLMSVISFHIVVVLSITQRYSSYTVWCITLFCVGTCRAVVRYALTWLRINEFVQYNNRLEKLSNKLSAEIWWIIEFANNMTDCSDIIVQN